MVEKDGLCDLARISLSEFGKHIKRCPAVTVGIGSIEWHGAHLPVGFDTLKADALCRRIADEVGCFAAPPLFYGYAYHFRQSGIMPAMHCDLDAFRDYLTSVFASFHEIGFKVIFALTGHYENLQVLTMKTAAQLAMDELPDLQVICHLEPDLTAGMTPGGDHAGPYETSLGLALFPELVRLDAGGTADDLNLGYAPRGGKAPDWDGWSRYFEDGKKASSPELGLKIAETIVHRAAEEVRDALANPGKYRKA